MNCGEPLCSKYMRSRRSDLIETGVRQNCHWVTMPFSAPALCKRRGDKGIVILTLSPLHSFTLPCLPCYQRQEELRRLQGELPRVVRAHDAVAVDGCDASRAAF